MELLDDTKLTDWPSLMRYSTKDSDTCFREMIRKMPGRYYTIITRTHLHQGFIIKVVGARGGGGGGGGEHEQ